MFYCAEVIFLALFEGKKKKKSSFGVSFRVIYNFLFLLDCKDVIMGYDSVEVNTRIIALKALLVRFFFF